MKRYKVVYSQSAKDDVRASHRWIGGRSLQSADRWLVSLLKSVDRLETHPLACPVADEIGANREELRVLLHGRKPNVYRVLFSVEKDRVLVVAVRHAARQTYLPDDAGE